MNYNNVVMVNNSNLEKNNLKVLTDYIPGKNSVSLSLWVKTGSRAEDKSVNGIAHFLEHMAFKSTKNRTTRQIAEVFDSIGGRFNACTGREHTIYYTYVLKEHLSLAMEIISDILQNALFLQEELTVERGVVLQEIAQTNDDPSDIIFDKHMETAYPDQAFGRSILGPPENIKNFNQSHLHDFIKNHYVAENMLLVVSGGIEHQEVHKIADKHFSSFLQHSPLQLPTLQESVYSKKEQNICLIERKELEQVNIVFSMLSTDYSNLALLYKVKILASILGGGMSSRLFQEVRENRGLAYAVSSFTSNYTDTGLFTIYSATQPTDIPELLDVIIQEMKKIIDHGVTDEELSRVRSQCEANILMSFDSISSRADKLGNNFAMYNRYLGQDEILDIIRSITKNDMQEILFSCMSQSQKPTISAIGNLQHFPRYEEIIEKFSV